MKYKITHTTAYQYSTPVSICHNVVILTPTANRFLDVQSHRINVRPAPAVSSRRRDMFGNSVYRFSLEQVHSQLSITATSKVTVTGRELPDAAEFPSCETVVDGVTNKTDQQWADVVPFTFDSPRIIRDTAFALYMKECISQDQSVFAVANKLTTRIYEDFRYDTDATQVDTPTAQAFQDRRGVCQDFAHVAVTCFRSIGLPARYVSGYLRTIPPPGKERLVGADQSHAWVSVYCGQPFGWVDFDPTNNCVAGTDHVPIASGRDYSDVVPLKGVFLGGGEPLLNVSVDVAPEETPEPAPDSASGTAPTADS